MLHAKDMLVTVCAKISCITLRIQGLTLSQHFSSKLTKTKFALVNGHKCDETHDT